MLSPLLDKLNEAFSDKIAIMKLNVDDNKETAVKFSIRGIPALLLFKDGKMVDSLEGQVPYQALTEFIEKHI